VFLAAFAGVGAIVAGYNFLRFGNPMEFGLRYLLAGGTNQQSIRLSWPNMWTGLYFLVVCPPDFGAVFPWVRLALRLPAFGTFPRDYFLEPIAGALWIAPFALFSAFVSSAVAAIRLVRSTALLAGVAVLLFVAATGFTTQRYLLDFLPLFVFAGVLSFAALLDRLTGWKRPVVIAGFCIVVAYSVVVNLALGLTGPYDEVLSSRPASYVRIARWFTFKQDLQPMLDPVVRVTLEIFPSALASGSREPLLALGGQGSRHVLYMEHRDKQAILVSHADTRDVPDATATIDNKPTRITFAYDPVLHTAFVSVDNQLVLKHPLPSLVTAPAQVVIGSNGASGFVGQTFSGRWQMIEKVVTPSESNR
jgi:hypothetical protein